MFAEQGKVVLTVDAVITDEVGRILLIQRGHEPFQGCWVLPGGIVEVGETVEQACAREVEEEVGLKVDVHGLVGVYSAPGRDPRGAFVSIAFHTTIVGGGLVTTDEAKAHRWLAPDEVLPMGFDHARIVADFRSYGTV